MRMRIWNGFHVVLVASTLALGGCSDSKFRGSGKESDTHSTLKPTKPIVDLCKDKSEVVGVDLAFVIDNSGSNVYTDCPNARRIGTDSLGNPKYQCNDVTNRESAVSDAYDALVSIANGDAASDSHMAIASFPGERDIYAGSDIRTDEWVKVSQNSSSTINGAMSFARLPLGMTPYGAGLNAAANMFDKLSKSPRPKLLILVTDGEPTDQNPGLVIDQVQDRLKDVKIVTVMVSQSATREARKAEHAQYLRRTLGYSTGVVEQLIGSSEEPGLAEKVSNKTIEIPASGKLKETFMGIISENVTCK